MKKTVLKRRQPSQMKQRALQQHTAGRWENEYLQETFTELKYQI